MNGDEQELREKLRRDIVARLLAMKGDDIEAEHSQADDLLCVALESFGWSDVVKAYHEVTKWYA